MGSKSRVTTQSQTPEQQTMDSSTGGTADNSGALEGLGVVSFTGGGGYVWRRGTDGAWTCTGGPKPGAIGKVFRPGDPVHAKIEAEYLAKSGNTGGASTATSAATTQAPGAEKSWWDDLWGGLGDLWEAGESLVEDAIGGVQDTVDSVLSWWSGEGAGEQPAAETPETQPKDEYAIVTDPDARLRGGPPDFAATGGKIPKDSEVHVLEIAYKPGAYSGYARVKPRAGGAELGWTAEANLTSSKELNPDWKPDKAVDLSDLTADETTMAKLYNEKGAFIIAEAARLGITAAVAAGTLITESGGRGYAADGRPIIRFENHQFYSRWGRNNADTYNLHFSYNRTRDDNGDGRADVWKDHKWRRTEQDAWAEVHANQGLEWEVLQFAMGLGAGADEAAAQSISIGAGQVMGFNYTMFGYASAKAMLEEMTGKPSSNIGGVFNFIAANANAKAAIQRNDFVAFATAYNGPGQAATYGAKIERLSKAWDSMLAKKQPTT